MTAFARLARAGLTLVASSLVAATGSSPALAATLSLKEIREARLVTQQWDTSCGAAAIATVLTYRFGDPVSEREVARGLLRQTEPLKVRHRGGFSMLDMKRYVEARGYKAIGFRGLSLDEIRYFDGVIVPIMVHGYSHYVVFDGLTSEGRVRLADPAFGNRSFSRERFEKAWVGGMAFVMLRAGG